ncbi:hypothetical protein [Georgenia faecalis]|uniref:hypothetical protein n=1 Tax=Georgenia faecalis TaxID=2483799 RepID=UPI000FD78EF3|nr:hypothetical protein [Georgenia faecalis]
MPPWRRKHDDPGGPGLEAATVVRPASLEELLTLCRERPPGQRLKAAGSHWALSDAAVSDHTFIETNDPADVGPALSRTLPDVVPDRLNPAWVAAVLARDEPSPVTYVHVEAGKRIYQLYAELDQLDDGSGPTLAGWFRRQHGKGYFEGRWAFATLGGAGGQTVVGALTTGTHGGDFTLPPLADSVVALHLVTDGGRHYWVEPTREDRLTDDGALRDLYGQARYGGPDAFEVIRDTGVFDAVLVSAGRMGTIYSVVLRAVRQYGLHEERRLSTWQDVRGLLAAVPGIAAPAPLYTAAAAGEVGNRFLQVAVLLTPHANFTRNRVGVTKRWVNAWESGRHPAAGRAERVGDQDGTDPRTGSPRFSRAGRSHPYTPDAADQSGDPDFLNRACSEGSFVRGVVEWVIEQVEDFVRSNGVAVGITIAAVGAAGGLGLLALAAALLAILVLLRELLEEAGADDTLGEWMEKLKDTLLDPDADPATRAAGLFVWQMISLEIFEMMQKDRDYDALSYAVMDQRGYLDISCEVNVSSMEAFFDARDPRLVAFVDALIAFETNQELHGRAFVGYASLRFTGPSRATLGMAQFGTSCSVEVAGLNDVDGGAQLVDFAQRLALNPNVGALLHWGQENAATAADVERGFGDSAAAPGGPLGSWRAVLARLTDNGRLDGFSSAATRAWGLEVVAPVAGSIAVDDLAPGVGRPISLRWDCAANPPSARLRLQDFAATEVRELGTHPLQGEIAHTFTTPGTHRVLLTVSTGTGGDLRTAHTGVTVTVTG